MITTRICAGIVLYNPDLNRLSENVEAIYEDVDKIFLVDNGSYNIDLVKDKFKGSRFEYVINSNNLGIATALNQLISIAKERNYEWILTLDQDSICGIGMLNEMKKAFVLYDNIAIVCPDIISRRAPKTTTESAITFIDVSMCITSGSLTNVDAILACSGFLDWMFIDYVDYEICLRLRRNGYKIIKSNKATLLQEYGEDTISVRFLWKKLEYNKYNALRVFYQTRNSVYMLRKYKHEFTPRPYYHHIVMIRRLLLKLFCEPDNRYDVVKNFIAGYIVGWRIKIRGDKY